MVDDSTRCLGRDPDGQQCICMRCSNTHVVDNKTLCSNCGHIESAHPEPRQPAGALIKQLRDAGKLSGPRAGPSSVLKATRDEAEAETKDGLQKKHKSTTDTEPPNIHSKKKKAASSKDKDSEIADLAPEDVFIGMIVFLVCGTAMKVQYFHARFEFQLTNMTELNSLEACKLAVMSTPGAGNSYKVNTGWSTAQCTRYWATVFPELFNYLDEHPAPSDPKASQEIQDQQWLAVIKQNQSVVLSVSELPTGAQLARYCQQGGKKATQRCLFLATKITIPSDRYENWDAPTDVEDDEMEEEKASSDFDVLDDSEEETPRKPKSKGKGKAKEIKLEKSSVKVEEEDSDRESFLPDMKMAAKMRTRIGTKSLVWNGIKFPTSDDGHPKPIEVSDDEAELPDASTLTSHSHLSLPSFTAPLFIDKSPSPDFDGSFDHLLPPSPTMGDVSGTSSGWTSTSSLAAAALTSDTSTSHLPNNSVGASSTVVSSTSIPLIMSGSSSSLPTTTDAGTSGTAGVVHKSSGLFKRSGKGLVNPWHKS
ncbi:hypothetical protein C8R43DRAFT_943970 [Mycena crocata]|nr:hypothetical protein C8R43DRAFT_943970 [Mycena crocata]